MDARTKKINDLKVRNKELLKELANTKEALHGASEANHVLQSLMDLKEQNNRLLERQITYRKAESETLIKVVKELFECTLK